MPAQPCLTLKRAPHAMQLTACARLSCVQVRCTRCMASALRGAADDVWHRAVIMLNDAAELDSEQVSIRTLPHALLRLQWPSAAAAAFHAARHARRPSRTGLHVRSEHAPVGRASLRAVCPAFQAGSLTTAPIWPSATRALHCR